MNHRSDKPYPEFISVWTRLGKGQNNEESKRGAVLDLTDLVTLRTVVQHLDEVHQMVCWTVLT